MVVADDVSTTSQRLNRYRWVHSTDTIRQNGRHPVTGFNNLSNQKNSASWLCVAPDTPTVGIKRNSSIHRNIQLKLHCIQIEFDTQKMSNWNYRAFKLNPIHAPSSVTIRACILQNTIGFSLKIFHCAINMYKHLQKLEQTIHVRLKRSIVRVHTLLQA